jgi:hypothetical protein
MPNGNPDFDLAELERFFAPIAASIEQFVARRNLALTKYYHESPSWGMGFHHPIGELGLGNIHLSKSKANTLEMSAGVWIDDYDSFTRYLRQTGRQDVPMNPATLIPRLDSTLDEVLDWKLDDQFIAYGGNQSWGRTPKAQWIARYLPKWPTPTRGGSET